MNHDPRKKHEYKVEVQILYAVSTELQVNGKNNNESATVGQTTILVCRQILVNHSQPLNVVAQRQQY